MSLFTSSPIVIGLTGAAGSGKDTAAQYLCEKWNGVDLALAEPIRAMLEGLSQIVGAGDAWMSQRELKEQPGPLGVSYRHLAQTIGTEWGRHIMGERWWLTVADLRIREMLPHLEGPLVITDIRFPNEAEWLKAMGGRLVRLWREAPGVRQHVSEAHWRDLVADHEVPNHGTKLELHGTLDQLMLNLLT